MFSLVRNRWPLLCAILVCFFLVCTVGYVGQGYNSEFTLYFFVISEKIIDIDRTYREKLFEYFPGAGFVYTWPIFASIKRGGSDVDWLA